MSEFTIKVKTDGVYVTHPERGEINLSRLSLKEVKVAMMAPAGGFSFTQYKILEAFGGVVAVLKSGGLLQTFWLPNVSDAVTWHKIYDALREEPRYEVVTVGAPCDDKVPALMQCCKGRHRVGAVCLHNLSQGQLMALFLNLRGWAPEVGTLKSEIVGDFLFIYGGKDACHLSFNANQDTLKEVYELLTQEEN